MLKLNRSAVSRYETEESNISTNNLVTICDYFKISIDYLLYLTDERLPHKLAKRKNKNRLKELRNNNNLTQKQLSKKLHIIQNGYSKYETSSHDITINILINLSEFYNTSIDYLLCRTDDKRKYSKSIIIQTKKKLINQFLLLYYLLCSLLLIVQQ